LVNIIEGIYEKAILVGVALVVVASVGFLFIDKEHDPAVVGVWHSLCSTILNEGSLLVEAHEAAHLEEGDFAIEDHHSDFGRLQVEVFRNSLDVKERRLHRELRSWNWDSVAARFDFADGLSRVYGFKFLDSWTSGFFLWLF
jgi:hypothetical protein